jgi:hypothetical protein
VDNGDFPINWLHLLCSQDDCFFSAIGKEKDLQEKEMKLMELQEVYETRLLQMKVSN